MKKFIGLVPVVAMLTIASCSKGGDNNNNDGGGGNNTVDCGTISAKFSANVMPLISNSCAKSGCHAAGSVNGPGELTSYAKISANKVAIRAVVSTGQMPKDATFNATQKATITCWIDAGALDN